MAHLATSMTTANDAIQGKIFGIPQTNFAVVENPVWHRGHPVSPCFGDVMLARMMPTETQTFIVHGTDSFFSFVPARPM